MRLQQAVWFLSLALSFHGSWSFSECDLAQVADGVGLVPEVLVDLVGDRIEVDSPVTVFLPVVGNNSIAELEGLAADLGVESAAQLVHVIDAVFPSSADSTFATEDELLDAGSLNTTEGASLSFFNLDKLLAGDVEKDGTKYRFTLKATEAIPVCQAQIWLVEYVMPDSIKVTNETEEEALPGLELSTVVQGKVGDYDSCLSKSITYYITKGGVGKGKQPEPGGGRPTTSYVNANARTTSYYNVLVGTPTAETAFKGQNRNPSCTQVLQWIPTAGKEVTNSYTASLTKTVGYSKGLSVTVAVQDVASATASYSWNLDVSSTQEKTQETATSWSTQHIFYIDPRTSMTAWVDVTSQSYRSDFNYDATWTGTMDIPYRDFIFSEKMARNVGVGTVFRYGIANAQKGNYRDCEGFVVVNDNTVSFTGSGSINGNSAVNVNADSKIDMYLCDCVNGRVPPSSECKNTVPEQ